MKNTEKLTYVSALTYAIENGNLPTDIAEKLIALRTQQEKRNNSDKKPTAKQTENEGLKELILNLLEGQSPKTISEIQAMDERLNPTVISNQRVASLVRLMVDDNKLVRTVEKRKAYFALAN